MFRKKIKVEIDEEMRSGRIGEKIREISLPLQEKLTKTWTLPESFYPVSSGGGSFRMVEDFPPEEGKEVEVHWTDGERTEIISLDLPPSLLSREYGMICPHPSGDYFAFSTVGATVFLNRKGQQIFPPILASSPSLMSEGEEGEGETFFDVIFLSDERFMVRKKGRSVGQTPTEEWDLYQNFQKVQRLIFLPGAGCPYPNNSVHLSFGGEYTIYYGEYKSHLERVHEYCQLIHPLSNSKLEENNKSQRPLGPTNRSHYIFLDRVEGFDVALARPDVYSEDEEEDTESGREFPLGEVDDFYMGREPMMIMGGDLDSLSEEGKRIVEAYGKLVQILNLYWVWLSEDDTSRVVASSGTYFCMAVNVEGDHCLAIVSDLRTGVLYHSYRKENIRVTEIMFSGNQVILEFTREPECETTVEVYDLS